MRYFQHIGIESISQDVRTAQSRLSRLRLIEPPEVPGDRKSVSLLILELSGKTVSTAAVNYFYGGVRIGEEEKANSRIWNCNA